MYKPYAVFNAIGSKPHFHIIFPQFSSFVSQVEYCVQLFHININETEAVLNAVCDKCPKQILFLTRVAMRLAVSLICMIFPQFSAFVSKVG